MMMSSRGDALFSLAVALMCFWIAASGRGWLRVGGLMTGPRFRAEGALRRVVVAAVGAAFAYIAYAQFLSKPLPGIQYSYIAADILLMALGVSALIAGLRGRSWQDVEALAVARNLSPRFIVVALRTASTAVGAVLFACGAWSFAHHI